MPPKFLGGAQPDLKGQDRRVVMAKWLASPDNPYFAKAIVNRVWANYLGKGLVEGVVGVGEPSLDGDDVYWLEGRPANGGRQTLVRLRGGISDGTGAPEDLTPPETNVRDRVHEYGGGAYVLDRGIAWFSDFTDGRLYRRDLDGSIRSITRSVSAALIL